MESWLSVGSHRKGGRRYQYPGSSLAAFLIGTKRIERNFLYGLDRKKSGSLLVAAILNAVIFVHWRGVDCVFSGIVLTSVPSASRSGFGIEFLAISRRASTTSPPAAFRLD